MVNNRWEAYPGHSSDWAHDLKAIIEYLETTHAEAMTRLQALPDSELQQARIALAGRTLAAWRLLMAIVEHEIHHRSQLASYLALLGITPPQIFGLEVDDVAAMSAALADDRSAE